MPEHDHTVTLEEWVNAACGAVVSAMRDGSEERKAAVAGQIAGVERQLPAELDDLTAFLGALRALLAGQTPADAGDQLGEWYADAFHRVVDSIGEPPHAHHHPLQHEHDDPHGEPEGRRLSLGEALEEIVRDTIHVMREGSREERAQMAQGLELLRFQAAGAMEWPAFAGFLQALQNLLRGKDPGNTDFEPPFDQAWARIREQLSVNSEQWAVNSEQ